MAEAVKKSNADIAVVTVGGFQDLELYRSQNTRR